jgi:hypothetical protein
MENAQRFLKFFTDGRMDGVSEFKRPAGLGTRLESELSVNSCTDYNHQVKEDGMIRACRTHEEKMNLYRVLVGKPQGKRPLGKPGLRLDDSIKMDLREIRWGSVDWIHPAQDRTSSGLL